MKVVIKTIKPVIVLAYMQLHTIWNNETFKYESLSYSEALEAIRKLGF